LGGENASGRKKKPNVVPLQRCLKGRRTQEAEGSWEKKDSKKGLRWEGGGDLERGEKKLMVSASRPKGTVKSNKNAGGVG